MKNLTHSFENGPDPGFTPEVLDILKQRDIGATSFVCGRGNPLHPALTANSDEARDLFARATGRVQTTGPTSR